MRARGCLRRQLSHAEPKLDIDCHGCGSCVWPAGFTELLPELVLEGVPLVAACLDGTLVDADDEASRDHAVVGVEKTDHVVVAATSRVEVVQVRSGRGEPDDEDDSR